jgi:hypothetical protein
MKFHDMKMGPTELHHKEIPGMHKQPKSPLWCCYYVEPTQVSNNTSGLHCHWKDWTGWQRIMESLDVKRKYTHNLFQRCSWNMKRQCTHIIGKPWIRRVEIRSSQAGWKERKFTHEGGLSPLPLWMLMNIFLQVFFQPNICRFLMLCFPYFTLLTLVQDDKQSFCPTQIISLLVSSIASTTSCLLVVAAAWHYITCTGQTNQTFKNKYLLDLQPQCMYVPAYPKS